MHGFTNGATDGGLDWRVQIILGGGNRKRPYEIGMIDMCIDGSLNLPEFLHTMILSLLLKGPAGDTRLETRVTAVVRDGGQGDGISVCKRFLIACTCC